MTQPNREDPAGRLARVAKGERLDRIYGAGRAGQLRLADDVAAALRQSPTVEEVARVIAPGAFVLPEPDPEAMYADGWRRARKKAQETALAKAQAIDALYRRGGRS